MAENICSDYNTLRSSLIQLAIVMEERKPNINRRDRIVTHSQTNSNVLSTTTTTYI